MICIKVLFFLHIFLLILGHEIHKHPFDQLNYCSFEENCVIHQINSCKNQDNLLIKTSYGDICGSALKTRKNRTIYAFRGIKYAQPPIGERRFSPPVPIKSWDGILDATKDGYMCPQPPSSIPKELTSEDCLILNIYTTNVSDMKPVIVYIHGGAYVEGGSHSEYKLGPQYLLDQDVVLVTFNYRLGPFGFLSTGTEDATGNYGFKDQVLVLRWVQDNIKNFGGDPTLVTLMGHSVGGISVSLHIASPMSKDLFLRAIPMSAAATSHYSVDNIQWTKKLAEGLSCPLENSKILVECLKSTSVNDIIEEGLRWETLNTTSLKWNFEIENDFGQERFLTENPINQYLNGDISKIPIMTGITRDEFTYIVYDMKSEVLDLFNTDFDRLAPIVFQYYNYPPNTIDEINKAIKGFYLNDQNITSTNLDKFGQLYNDATILHGIHRFVSFMRKYKDVYYYEIDFLSPYSHYYNTEGKSTNVCHGDELQYLFVSKRFAPVINENDPENVMIERLTSWISTFAKTGNPNDPNNNWTNIIEWKPSNVDNLQMLYINDECNMSDEPYQERFKFWDELFPVA